MNSREEILHLLAPLTSILRMPDDLIGILAVARRLVPVLRSLVRVTDEKQQPLISACLAGLEQVIDGASCVAQFFPEALGGGRRILKGYYASHPHYCVFWHVCADPELEQQYGTLLVSMFPVQMRLERDRTLINTVADPAYMVGLSLRQLTDRPDESLRPFLLELPLEPMHPQALLEHFENHMSRLGLRPLVTGTLRNLGYLHRALQWFETGVWEVQHHLQTGRADRHKAGRHGAIDGTQPSRSISRTLEGDDGLPDIGVTQFVEDDGSTHRHDRDLDFSPPGDGPKRGTLIAVAPRSASAANRGDRRALARNVARYTAQAITLVNQQLPVTHATLSGYEMELLVDLIDNLTTDDWGEIWLYAVSSGN